MTFHYAWPVQCTSINKIKIWRLVFFWFTYVIEEPDTRRHLNHLCIVRAWTTVQVYGYLDLRLVGFA
jgi:hypothetical protein